MGSFRGACGKLVDALVIGLACLQSKSVFGRRASVAGTLPGRIAARRVHIRQEYPVRRWGRSVLRAEVAIETLEGTTATFYDRYLQPDRATVKGLLVYHHGLGESPYDFGFARTLLRPEPLPHVDLIAIKSTYRGAFWGSSHRVLSDAACWLDMIADSIAVAGHIGERFRSEYQVMSVSGVSLGGIVTMGTLADCDRYDLYLPMLVGPDVPAHLRESPFSWYIRRDVLDRMTEEQTFADLDFRTVVARHSERVRFAVGEYDTVFRFDRFRAFAATTAVQYAVIPQAHVLGGLNGKGLRAIIVQNLEEWLRRLPAS